MKKFAVIDIGSNSVRLMFVADGKVLYKRLRTTRLGEGLAAAPFLKEEAIARSAAAVSDFYGQAVQEGAEKVLAFATAAVRTAKNGSVFVDRVKKLCGLCVEVISGEEEATIGITGALGTVDGGVIDVGGASTEIVVKQGDNLIYKKSVDIGVVRLKDTCGRDKEQLYATCNHAIKEFKNVPKTTMYAIGGTATTVAALVLKLQEYRSEQVTGAEITFAQLRELSETLLKLSVQEIAVMPCVSEGRADVLAGGAVLLCALMEKLQIDKLIVSDRDNLEGYAIQKGLL